MANCIFSSVVLKAETKEEEEERKVIKIINFFFFSIDFACSCVLVNEQKKKSQVFIVFVQLAWSATREILSK